MMRLTRRVVVLVVFLDVCVAFGVKCKSNDHCLYDTCLSADRGDCLDGCKRGWYGQFCQQPCPVHCFARQCHINETCEIGCITGFYREKCDLNCSAHCLDGCDQLSGECFWCDAGWYGSTCQSECSAGCAGKNKNCYRGGTCIIGCRIGYFGEKCDSTCLEQCYGDLCDATTGACTTGCESGYFGSFCNLTCMNCQGGDCDRITGKCTENLVPYIIGGGVVFILLVVAVFMACCMKWIHNVIYINAGWGRRPPSSTGSAVAPGNVERNEELIITPPIVCPNRLMRQTSYIHPRHSGGSASILQIEPARADSSVVHHYDELNESQMTLPQPSEVVQASAPMSRSSSLADVPDVYADKKEQDKENATGGEITIPLIAECFQSPKIENSSPDEESIPENYENPFRDHYSQ